MASVGAVYAARQLISATALKAYLAVGSLLALWQLTWIHKVFANWANVGLEGTAKFVTYAFVHTQLPTQLALIVFGVAALLLVRDAVRSFSTPRFAL